MKTKEREKKRNQSRKDINNEKKKTHEKKGEGEEKGLKEQNEVKFWHVMVEVENYEEAAAAPFGKRSRKGEKIEVVVFSELDPYVRKLSSRGL